MVLARGAFLGRGVDSRREDSGGVRSSTERKAMREINLDAQKEDQSG